ncbi:MAG: carboxypeptidase-like regulatory domain-containing protein [Bacteroidales bacterium]|nr:carboxypeptidase-like regulatory domain-containing protein [Bacteroidales bacterium]MBN2763195.1 carboxypeptidase-like regulatory domain-containing protein [Bacteroidales bacterium]
MLKTASKYHAGLSPKSLSYKVTRFIPFLCHGSVKIYFFLVVLSWQGLIKGQDTLLYQKITIVDTTISVNQAFQLISEHTGLNFSFNPDIIDLSKNIRLDEENESLYSVLNEVLRDPSLEYRLIGRQIVIYRPVVVKRYKQDPSQKGDSVTILEIRGRVLDIHNKKPVPFANICLVGRSIGTVANLQGIFLLKINAHHLNDSLGISCMGYQQLILPVIDFVAAEQDYYLKPDFIPIQEVIIRQTNPISLLTSAIEKIPENYPLDPALLTSFYREIVTKNSRVVAVSEAILQTYKTEYNLPVSGDQIKIIKGRKTINAGNSDTIILKLKAGLNTTLLLDVAKNLPDFFMTQNFEAYAYRMTDMMISDQNEFYVIRFSPRENYQEALYSGRIFLELKNLAIAAVEFEVDPERMTEASHMFVLKKPRYLRVKPQKASYRVEFRRMEGLYYLNLIRCETVFRIRHKKQLFASVYSTILEMAVTEVETDTVERFRYKETVRSQEIFMEQIADFQDSYWGEYNFIKPEEPLKEAILRLGND